MHLRESLTKKAIEYAKSNDMPYDEYSSAIIFKNIEDNFYPLSFQNITKNDHFKDRLSKSHPNVKNALEMQSSNSSDALLMNIFCHPRINKWNGPKKLLSLEAINPIFGYKPGVLKNRNIKDDTEIDMVIGDIFFEAKLTETDFTKKHIMRVLEYNNLDTVFNLNLLTKKNNQIEGYQIIRNILAAYQCNKSHRLICDIRRGDLVREYYKIVNAIKIDELKLKMGVLFWQEIIRSCGANLKNFIKTKYGIE